MPCSDTPWTGQTTEHADTEETDVSTEAPDTLSYWLSTRPPDLYLCLDVEATCDGSVVPSASNNSSPRRRFERGFSNEVLELPVEVVDSRTGACYSDYSAGWRFHSYIAPEKDPTTFCCELTGISTKTLDGAPSLLEALRKLEAWLSRRCLVPWPQRPKSGQHSFVWVTDGSWDFGKFLYHDCKRKGVRYPAVCQRWCDARAAFKNTWPETGLKPPILQNMVASVGLPWTGEPHRGHVDARNLAALVGVLTRCNPGSLIPTRCIPASLLSENKRVTTARTLPPPPPLLDGSDVQEQKHGTVKKPILTRFFTVPTTSYPTAAYPFCYPFSPSQYLLPVPITFAHFQSG
eukprot:Sspe_Gene.11852::Locus_4025_Transcript_1_1_Confidence_1.000_Length_1213::g.11852::m.11852/K18416/THEX1, ERI1; 3'-5' exoribonuclease 1